MLRWLAAALLVVGLGLAVLVAFFGVERRRGHAVKRPHPAINLPAIAAALIAWGAIAYPLARTELRLWATVVIALAGAALAWIAMGALLAKWALKAPLQDPHDFAELIQGHVAIVSSAIAHGSPGLISYRLRDESHEVRAVSLDGQPIAVGTDVVIDRIEQGIAYVEPWALVEPRL